METKIFNIYPCYELEISENSIKIYSHSKYKKGIKKELSQYLTVDKGYLRVKLNNKHHLIHHLVAKYCIGERPKDLVINHIDGNKLNNYPKNLEYITRKSNVSKSVEQGLHVSNNPITHGKYIDGRALKSRIPEYKKEWYLKNKERILEKAKQRYNLNK